MNARERDRAERAARIAARIRERAEFENLRRAAMRLLPSKQHRDRLKRMNEANQRQRALDRLRASPAPGATP